MFVWTRGRLLLTVGVIINAIVLVSWLLVSNYLASTEIVPRFGGRYVEGAVGRPINLSPIVAITDVDEDLSHLIFSGLTRIDVEGKLVGDLATDWTITEDNLTYTFNLRPNVVWHDGAPFTADDVAFTIGLIQNEAFPGSFGLREEWKGVQVAVVDSQTVTLTLPDPYAPFIESTTLGIVPKHKLEAIPIADLLTTPFNQEPVGTGMYRFEGITSKETTILNVDLVANATYFGQMPYLEKMTFRFFENDHALVEALKKHEVLAVRSVSAADYREVSELRNVILHETQLPRYQAVFINLQRNPILSDTRVRAALSMAVDRQQLIDTVLAGHGEVVDGPILQSSWVYVPPEEALTDIERANQLLDEAGWVKNEETGIRMLADVTLSLTLVSDDDPDRRHTAFELASMWEKIGVQTEVRLFGVGTFVDTYLQGREFDLALFGQSISWDPDVYAFWHSSQGADPGLNLSRLEDSKIDKLLEDARRVSDPAVRKEKYATFQKLIREIKPAIFLYSPSYEYVVSEAVHETSIGFMASLADRFAALPNWYLETTRIKSVVDKAPAPVNMEQSVEAEKQVLVDKKAVPETKNDQETPEVVKEAVPPEAENLDITR